MKTLTDVHTGEAGDDPADRPYTARRRHARPGPKSLVHRMLRQLGEDRARPPYLPSAVDRLDVPPLLPGEPPPGARHPFGDGHVGLYDNDGEPILTEPAAQFVARLRAIRRRVARTTLYHRGAPVVVSTVFLACDAGQAVPGGLVLLWETMLFSGRPRAGGRPGSATGHRWRYASAAAAVSGHARVVSTLRAAYAAARPVARARPQRAGARAWAGHRRRKGWRR